MPSFIALKSGSALAANFLRLVNDPDLRVGLLRGCLQQRLKRAAIRKFGLVVAILAQRMQICLEDVVHRIRSLATHVFMLQTAPPLVASLIGLVLLGVILAADPARAAASGRYPAASSCSRRARHASGSCAGVMNWARAARAPAARSRPSASRPIARQTGARGSLPGEPRELRPAERVGPGEETLLCLDEGRFALAGAQHLRRRERRGAAEAAVEMHVLDPEGEDGEIGEAGVEPRLGIALQIPQLGAGVRAPFDHAAEG